MDIFFSINANLYPFSMIWPLPGLDHMLKQVMPELQFRGSVSGRFWPIPAV
jgi:hypothetical protein